MKKTFDMKKVAGFLIVSAVSADFGLSQEQPAASKLTTIYTFAAGVSPTGGMVRDQTGALYGATSTGGDFSAGTVFQLTPPTTRGGGWTETVLHSFGVIPDGSQPLSTGLVFDTQGRLYGTTFSGGIVANSTLGTVFQLTPPAAPGGAWSETVIYSFAGGSDGANPESGLVFGKNGVLYGTTFNGGGTVCAGAGCGTVFALKPPAAAGGAWAERVIYRFPESGPGGQGPTGSLLLGKGGALYGMTTCRATGGGGYVFQMKPPAAAGGAWTETVLQSFNGFPAINPEGLTFGKNGSLYGTTGYGGAMNAGSVFVLTPPAVAGGAWTETVLYSFSTTGDGFIPQSGVLFGKNGALYGTTAGGGANGLGTVYVMKPPATVGGPWSESVLYSFANTGDSGQPGALVIGSNGALYGATTYPDSADTVFQFIP